MLHASIDSTTGAMVGGGSVAFAAANSNKAQESVNLLYYNLWQFEEFFISPSTIISFIGSIAAIWGIYRAFKGGKK